MLFLHRFIEISLTACVVVEAGFFVQLKTPLTIEKLLAQDDKTSTSSHIRPLIDRVFSFGEFEGFSGNFSKLIVKRLIKSDLVKNIVRDSPVKVFGYIPIKRSEEDNIDPHIHLDDGGPDGFHLQYQTNAWSEGDETLYHVQEMAPRHLASLSRQGPLPFNQSVNYYYDPGNGGQDVTVYVIDTGIKKDHPEFGERVVEQHSFSTSSAGYSAGHGTHVAGIIGSRTFGVAKKVQMIDLKALDDNGSGSLISVLSAIEFAAKHREDRHRKGVINLSLGSLKNGVLNAALEAAVSSGMVVVAAAGNFASDSCRTSPASAEGVISVGAFDDRTDSMAYFANYGECVDVLASGIEVSSVSHKFTDRPAVMSGTSMSAPSIAGLAAVLLSQGIDPKDVRSKIVEDSRRHRIKNTVNNTPNRAAFNGIKKEDDEYPQSAMYDPTIHGSFQPEFPGKIHGAGEANEMRADVVFATSWDDFDPEDYDDHWWDDVEDEDDNENKDQTVDGDHFDFEGDDDDAEIQQGIRDGILLVNVNTLHQSPPYPLIWY